MLTDKHTHKQSQPQTDTAKTIAPSLCYAARLQVIISESSSQCKPALDIASGIKPRLNRAYGETLFAAANSYLL